MMEYTNDQMDETEFVHHLSYLASTLILLRKMLAAKLETIDVDHHQFYELLPFSSISTVFLSPTKE